MVRWLMVLLCCCAAAAASADPRELSSAEKAVVEEAVRAGFDDPDAARFRWLPWGGRDAYCGEVNGKNLYGAYAGYKRYVADIQLGPTGQVAAAKLRTLIERETGDVDDVSFRALYAACLSYSR